MSDPKMKQYEELLKVKLEKQKYPFIVKDTTFIETLKKINLIETKSGGSRGIVTIITG